MKPCVVLYTHSAVLAPALSLAHALSRGADCHLLLELGPSAWQMELLDSVPERSWSGIIPAEPVIGHAFPEAVRAMWRSLASFHLVSHDTTRAIHPSSWRLSRRVARFIRSLQPDVVHFDDVSKRMLPALPGLNGVPVVLSLHDPTFHAGEVSWRGDLVRRMLLRRAQRVILHNRALLDPFRARYRVAPERISIVRLGVYRLARAWSAGSVCDDASNVLFFGRLSAYKGLDVLYEAMPAVAQRVPNAQFTIAGQAVNGYQLPRPPQRVRLEVCRRYIPNGEAARLFERSSVVVCPYREATQSGVALTAYAFEKPVVPSAAGGLPEYVHPGETGLLAPPGDAAALADALVDVLSDADLRHRLSAGIRRLGHSDLNWSRAAEDTLAVYREAMRSVTK